MINNKLNIDEIIIRYLDGTATDSDKEQLLTWLKESDKNLHSYSEFRDVWFASQSNSSVHSDMEKALKRLEKRIKGKESEKEKELRKSGAKLDTLALSKEEKEKARKMLKDADLE